MKNVVKELVKLNKLMDQLVEIVTVFVEHSVDPEKSEASDGQGHGSSD